MQRGWLRVMVRYPLVELVEQGRLSQEEAGREMGLSTHGLLRPSLPSRPERELRELSRYLTTLVRERASEVNRIQKVLEGANIKLASVASNVVGISGRAMLAALVSGGGPVRLPLPELLPLRLVVVAQ